MIRQSMQLARLLLPVHLTWNQRPGTTTIRAEGLFGEKQSERSTLTRLGAFDTSKLILSRIRLAWQIRGRGWQLEERTFTKAQELRSFLFLSVIMAPALAGIIVAGWGFIVWMYQLVAGPPVR